MKRVVLIVLKVLLVLTLAAAPAAAAQAQPQKPAATDEFVPVAAPQGQQDTIPAPRLVAIAYAFIWVVLFGYVWSVRSRLGKVEREIEAVGRRVPERK